ncbi:MAG TPA: hypothetical protein VJ596_01555 [Gemmatimonadaceae bacterium]|nr:hypothetical protein [Gemmatimonadaceae bacterium]
MAQPELVVKMRWGGEDDPGEAERRWPLSTLVAYLFEGRECDDVRSLLAKGRGKARLRELTWPPVQLTPAQLTEIERSFPQGTPPEPFDAGRATSVELKMPAMHPSLAVPLRVDQPLVRAAAARAAHLRFDYGPWADLYVATLTPAEASALLHNPARRVGDEGEAELAARVIGEDDASLYFTVPREGSPPPWVGAA